MADLISIVNLNRPHTTPIRAAYCRSFLCRFRGLMMRKDLNRDEGLMLVEKKESRVNASIHMLFMNFDIAVVWINCQQKVVDIKLARKWRSIMQPASPAQYILELHKDRLQDFQIGDQLKFEQG